MKSYRQFIVYLITGGTATLSDVGLFMILIRLHVWYITASIISASIGFLLAFVLHKYVAFRKKDNTVEHFIRFCLLFLWNLTATTCILYVCVHWLQLSPDVSKIISTGSVVLWNYFLYKFLVYV